MKKVLFAFVAAVVTFAVLAVFGFFWGLVCSVSFSAIYLNKFESKTV